MNILGYSERGLVNALLYEIGNSPNAEDLMSELLSLVQFPPHGKRPGVPLRIDSIMIEQSFSDFGDADAVLLGSAAGRPATFFIEAKVKSCARNFWTLNEEFGAFADSERENASSSNLFSQVYHKARLVTGLKAIGLTALQEQGLVFPVRSSKRIRRIGKNKVVLRAVEQILSHHDEVFFVALLPDSPENAKRFFANDFPQKLTEDYQDWDTSCFGYACWSEIERFCRNNRLHGLDKTVNVFEFNKGQIY